MKSINKKLMEEELYRLLYMIDCPCDVTHKYNLTKEQYPYFMLGFIRNSILYMLDDKYVYDLIKEYKDKGEIR